MDISTPKMKSIPFSKKYENQLHVWTAHVQSIVKERIKLEVQATTAKFEVFFLIGQDGGEKFLANQN